ncbi:metallophosphatase family protein [candidate division KSB3 bacterium]|uniref:Metallophosphatase family protein n=1 Tax=candidate division KSB3 bacterium TaxID=2044937 RepID=A0A2G6E7I1_9BACT|nr:MAG: metallophosphatase family protein [candidate division KSB3 bacterium]PIE30413.1 MAG: metallophosphatase family protein [candidate division KSB3 bacterium]
MKYFFFSDIHGNVEALNVVLAQIEHFAPDKVICLGDVVGYGPNPNECVELVDRYADVVVMGNHDHAVLGLTDITYFNQYAKTAVLWTRQVMSDENLACLSAYPFQETFGDVLCVHSTPLNPWHWDYIFNPLEGRYYLQHFEEHVCFIGHSHQPVFFEQDERGHVSYDRRPELSLTVKENCKYIVNDGSVGQPRDGYPQAAYATYDTERQQIEVKRLPYDVKKTQQKMAEANLPAFLIERLAHGR